MTVVSQLKSSVRISNHCEKSSGKRAHIHGVPFGIKTIRIISKVRLYCNKNSFLSSDYNLDYQSNQTTYRPCLFWLFAWNRDCPRQFDGKSNAAEFDRFETYWNGMPADAINRKRKTRHISVALSLFHSQWQSKQSWFQIKECLDNGLN